MATDFTKAPLEILVDLIDLTNGAWLTTKDISFGPVSVILNGTRNTGVTVSAILGSAYEGIRALTYNRVHFADVPRGRNTVFEDESADHISDLVPAINAAYQINLQPEDYFDDSLPTAGDIKAGIPGSFVLRARPESYIYRGEVTLLTTDPRTPLSDIFTVKVLNGFTYQGFTFTKPILSGFTYQGFTFVKPILSGFFYEPTA